MHGADVCIIKDVSCSTLYQLQCSTYFTCSNHLQSWSWCVAGAVATLGNGQFGVGTGPIHLDRVVCDEDERALIDCYHSPIGDLTSGCDTHTRDAGVICGRLRVVGHG